MDKHSLKEEEGGKVSPLYAIDEELINFIRGDSFKKRYFLGIFPKWRTPPLLGISKNFLPFFLVKLEIFGWFLGDFKVCELAISFWYRAEIDFQGLCF